MREASYKITEKDYALALMLHGQIQPKFLIIIVISIVAVLMLSLFWKPLIATVVVGSIFGGVIALLVGHFLLSPIMAKRHYRQYKAIHDTFTIQLSDEGVTFLSSTATGIVEWDSILKWRENNMYVLIYIMPRLYHIVPKSIATQGFDISELTRKLNDRVGSNY